MKTSETLCVSMPAEIAQSVREVAAAEDRPVSRVMERAFRLYMANQRLNRDSEA